MKRRDIKKEESGKKYEGRWAIRLSKQTEKEYIEIEERKQEIKRFIANYRGQAVKEYPMKPYQVFEAKYLDDDSSFMARDFKQFLNCMSLHRWDKETNSFLVGENW